jgi:Zn-dependent membrane protease YugP
LRGTIKAVDQEPVKLDYATPPRRYRIPLYRKILAGIMISAGAAMLIAVVFVPGILAQAHFTIGLGLVLWGLVVLFQHVKLW